MVTVLPGECHVGSSLSRYSSATWQSAPAAITDCHGPGGFRNRLAFSQFRSEAWTSNIKVLTPAGYEGADAVSIFPRHPWPALSAARPCPGLPQAHCHPSDCFGGWGPHPVAPYPGLQSRHVCRHR